MKKKNYKFNKCIYFLFLQSVNGKEKALRDLRKRSKKSRLL